MESPYPYENEDPEDEKVEVEGETLGLLNSDTWFGIANSTGQNPKTCLVQINNVYSIIFIQQNTFSVFIQIIALSIWTKDNISLAISLSIYLFLVVILNDMLSIVHCHVFYSISNETH